MDLAWWAARAKIGDPGRPTPGMVRFIRGLVRPLARALHRPRFEGAENLPRSGPFLLVANHSGGIAIAEVGCFIARYVDDVGPERPLAGFAHPIGFSIWPVSAFMRSIGAIPSTYDAARSTIAKGVPILVFPGGDHEGLRPIWQAHRVDFGGRLGFLKLAREAGVPIVPMGIRGSHFTAPILFRARFLSWIFLTRFTLRAKRWSISALGLAGAVAIFTLVPLALPFRAALAWVWLQSPLVFLPWVPWTIRFRIGEPIAPEDLFRGNDLPEALARVESVIQALVRAR